MRSFKKSLRRVHLQLDALEGRALLANIFEMNSAIIQREIGRLNVRHSLGADARQIQAQLIQDHQDAADKAQEIEADALGARQQAQADAAAGDKAAVRADRDQISADDQLLKRVREGVKEEDFDAAQAFERLKRDFADESKATKQDEKAIRGGDVDPNEIVDLGDARDQKVNDKGQSQTDAAVGKLQRIDDQIVNLQVGVPPSQQNSGGGAGNTTAARTVGPLIGSLSAHSSLTNMDVSEPLGATLKIAKDGTISGPADVESQPIVDTSTGQTVGHQNSSSGRITGTFRQGSLASKGTFEFTFPPSSVDPTGHSVSIQWQATITDTGMDGILLIGSQKVGTFTLMKGTR